MDTTETYIKMCDCEEIQGQSSCRPIALQSGINYSCEYVFVATDIYSNDCRIIWLPRQDQLQEMLDYGISTKVVRFAEWVSWASWKLDSFEQLWLAFVMKEKYNKTWNGKKWERL